MACNVVWLVRLLPAWNAAASKLVAAKFLAVSQELAETHYAIHKGKPFYEGLISYITSAPVMAMVWEGPDAIAAVRQTMGATRPTEAAPGSVRHDFGLEVGP